MRREVIDAGPGYPDAELGPRELIDRRQWADGEAFDAKQPVIGVEIERDVVA